MMSFRKGSKVTLNVGHGKEERVPGLIVHRHPEHYCVLLQDTDLYTSPLVQGQGCDGMLRVPYHSPLTGETYDYSIRRAGK